MPVEAKLIFRPDVIRLPLARFSLPESVVRRAGKLDKWAKLLASGDADTHKEQEILPRFLADIFYGLLGYNGPEEDSKRYTMSLEKHVEVNGKYADAVLGDFGRGKAPRYVVAVEGKGPKDPLDRPFAGRKLSAVDQAYDYAINLRCNWILVTSMRETRLYHKGSDKLTFERFRTEDLARDEKQLKKFVFLLHADRVVPASGPCHLDSLLQDSEKVGRELTDEFYGEYAFVRRSTVARLLKANPAVEPRQILACAQKLLDRILFIAFCEDRELLPKESIEKACTHRDPYNPRTIWDTFRGMFRAINLGSEALGIPRYNGGLFEDDPILDGLIIPDKVFEGFLDLAKYNFRPASEVAIDESTEDIKLIDVEILGHIFEQSINDLEHLRAELEKPITTQAADEGGAKASRRKREGAFYTPAYITRYIVEQALGGVLRDRFEALRRTHVERAKRTSRKALDAPEAYDLEGLTGPQREALLALWLDWQVELGSIRILDPACGSGAFLIEAFDQLHAEYDRTNERVRELRGHAELFDLDRKILQENLYGVDLNEEAVHIAKFSLWIKTAVPGKILTSLDHTLREGNSVVADQGIDPRAFDWHTAFPEVFDLKTGSGGFDVVIGNPPYIRQKWLSPIKAYLQSRYAAYHGMADLYVYFYELGLSLLRPGGRLSYVVTNKWMKAGYGEPLRTFFAEKAWVESIVDFGHAKQVFEEADVFPCIIVVRQPLELPAPDSTTVCTIAREHLRIDDLRVQIAKEGVSVERSRLSSEAWQLEPRGVVGLVAKIRDKGIPLTEYANTKPFYGIKTCFNESFLIDSALRESLIAKDPKCQEIIRPYLRGQDIKRWSSEWAELWIIFTRRGIDIDAYSSVKEHLLRYQSQLEPKPKEWVGESWQGRKPGSYLWYEVQDPIEYWREFRKPKIVYQEIQFHPSYAMDYEGRLGNNKIIFIPSDDLYLLCVLNSPLIWWHNYRYLPHMKDEALTPVGFLMEKLPIARPSDRVRTELERAAKRLIEISKVHQAVRNDFLDWLRVEHGVEEPNTQLQSCIELASETLVSEVRKARGKKNPLSVAALRSLRDEHAQAILPAQVLAAEALGLERKISDLVNQAYGLTPDEVELMWETAPPRMPFPSPPASSNSFMPNLP